MRHREAGVVLSAYSHFYLLIVFGNADWLTRVFSGRCKVVWMARRKWINMHVFLQKTVVFPEKDSCLSEKDGRLFRKRPRSFPENTAVRLQKHRGPSAKTPRSFSKRTVVFPKKPLRAPFFARFSAFFFLEYLSRFRYRAL